MNGDDLAERVIRLEAQREALDAKLDRMESIIEARLTGYVRGKVDEAVRSINHNLEANQRSSERRHDTLERALWGESRRNGLYSEVRSLRTWLIVLAAVLSIVAGAVGVRFALPLLP